MSLNVPPMCWCHSVSVYLPYSDHQDSNRGNSYYEVVFWSPLIEKQAHLKVIVINLVFGISLEDAAVTKPVFGSLSCRKHNPQSLSSSTPKSSTWLKFNKVLTDLLLSLMAGSSLDRSFCSHGVNQQYGTQTPIGNNIYPSSAPLYWPGELEPIPDH